MYRSQRGIRMSGGQGPSSQSSSLASSSSSPSAAPGKQPRRYWTPEDNAVRNRIGNLIHQGNKVMVIVRGLPGSGKSTLAKLVMLL